MSEAISVLRNESAFPGQGIFHDQAGMPVDGTGQVWRLNNPRVPRSLNWELMPPLPPGMLSATTAFFRATIETQNPQSAYNTFAHLREVLGSETFQRDFANEGLDASTFRAYLHGQPNPWRAHYARQWYGWCATMGYPDFSAEVALEISRLRIGGNEKGRAVLSADPEDGPLLDQEVSSLINALRASDRILSLREQAVIWLCLALGPNPLQVALLREQDVKIIKDGDQPAFIHLSVPRMKKREARMRSSFRSRALTWEIGSIVVRLMEENAMGYHGMEVPEHLLSIRPLIKRDSPLKSLLGTPLEELTLHHSSPDIGRMLSDAVDRLRVPSRTPGQYLKVTCRRLRYTFATRLVREGVSQREVADLLDHTDLQHVQVYFDIKSDIVEKLDRAMAMALAPIAQAFMGQIVLDAGKAVRGGDPASKVAVHDKEVGAIREVGTCGEFSFCRLSAPVACYTCAKFQPWVEAPHHLLLDDLLKDRERKREAGMDGRMVTLMDSTIIAIADVIHRIETHAVGGAA